ncbi:MAG: hypothetical protein ACAH17_02015 [Candidatus Paceibacterota bacterium]|jgi:hypothetical protein
MYGIPNQGLNPEYKPDDQSRVVVAPSDAGPLPASESFSEQQVLAMAQGAARVYSKMIPKPDPRHSHTLSPLAAALMNRIHCEGCE